MVTMSVFMEGLLKLQMTLQIAFVDCTTHLLMTIIQVILYNECSHF